MFGCSQIFILGTPLIVYDCGRSLHFRCRSGKPSGRSLRKEGDREPFRAWKFCSKALKRGFVNPVSPFPSSIRREGLRTWHSRAAKHGGFKGGERFPDLDSSLFFFCPFSEICRVDLWWIFWIKFFSDFSKAKFANPNPCAPCCSEFLDPLSWCGCRGCVLLRSHLLVLAWWWFAGWIWVSAVFRLAWRVSSARMVFGKLLVFPGAPTAWSRGESQDRGQADAGLARHGQKQVIWVQHVLTGRGQVAGEGLGGADAVPCWRLGGSKNTTGALEARCDRARVLVIYGPPGRRARKISNAKSRRYGAAATGFTQTLGSGCPGDGRYEKAKAAGPCCASSPEPQTAKSDKKNRLIRRFFRLKTCLINLSEKVVIRQNFCLIKSSENWNQTNLSDKISVCQNRLTRGCQTIWSDNFKGFCLKQGFQTIYWRKLSDKFDANQASKETWWNQLNCGVHLDAPIQHACSSLIQMLPGLLVQKLPGLLRPDSDIARPSKGLPSQTWFSL